MAAETERPCPSVRFVKATLLLQEKWILFIVWSLMEGPLGFNEIGRRARGVNTTTLSQRMDLLEEQGIVTKEIHCYMPPRTSYALTEAGLGLRTVIEAIGTWGANYLTDEAPAVECESETLA